MLRIQISRRRRKRLQKRIEDALEQAGSPYRRIAVVAYDTSDDTMIELLPLGVFLTRLEQVAQKESDAETRAWLFDCLAQARGYYDRALLPEFVTFAEGGAELNTITPPEGTW